MYETNKKVSYALDFDSDFLPFRARMRGCGRGRGDGQIWGGSPRAQRSDTGFTLVELVVSLSIMSIIGAMIAVFMRHPIEQYAAMSRRAAMTDSVDGAVRRMSRDITSSIPNSVRVDASGHFIEMLHMRSAGRYRAEPPGDLLDFTGATDILPSTASFDVLGPAVTTVAGDSLVVYNLGIPGSDAYNGGTRSITSSGTVSKIAFTPTSSPFLLESPDHRFFVVDTPVTYACDLVSGTIKRYSGYAIAAVQPTPPDVNGFLVLDKVSACQFAYAPGLDARFGLVQVALTVTREGEVMTLHQTIQVDNTP